MDRLVWSGIIGSPHRGRGGGLSRGWLRSAHSGAWNHGRQASGYGLKKAYVFSGEPDPNWGRQGRGVCAVNLKLTARGNWRNVCVIGYQIGRKGEIIRNNTKKHFLPGFL